MGAYDGNSESTTRFFEGCLGWRGVLVEAMPRLFRRVVEQRRSSLNLRLAACERHGWVNFTNFEEGYASISKAVTSFADGTYAGSRLSPSLVSVQCGPLGDYLAMLNVRRIDFFSLDVEGAELVAIQGLNLASGRLSVGVLMVEVRGDGVRPRVLEALLALGFTYVGQVHGRPSQLNEVIDDIYVNETHLREHFPESAWLQQARAAGSARLISRAPSRRFARSTSAKTEGLALGSRSVVGSFG
jgi:FkbM family methyltransferase